MTRRQQFRREPRLFVSEFDDPWRKTLKAKFAAVNRRFHRPIGTALTRTYLGIDLPSTVPEAYDNLPPTDALVGE